MEKTTSQSPAGQAKPLATILLVDDEDYIRELIDAVLSCEGYRVLSTDSPAHAVEMANSQGPVDLILCEAGFSGGASAGYLLRMLREKHPGIRALIMTGYPDPALTHFGVANEEIVFKPFTPKQLMARIVSALAEVRVA